MNNQEGTKEFCPDWYSVPGRTISELLHRKDMSLYAFAKLMDKEELWCSRLLMGDEIIDSEIAEKLEKAVGGTKAFWENRESQYRIDKARIESKPS